MLLLLKTFIVFDEIPCASFKYKKIVERKHDIGRLWETLGDFGRQLYDTYDCVGFSMSLQSFAYVSMFTTGIAMVL